MTMGDRASSSSSCIRIVLSLLLILASSPPWQQGQTAWAQEQTDADETVVDASMIGSWWTEENAAADNDNNNTDGPPVRADIVGGDPAASGRYPWYAIPDVSQEGAGLCGGFLIAPDFVLTAAHCGGVFRPGRTVFLGAHRRDGSDAIAAAVARREIRHQQFYQEQGPFRMWNDIMLVQLEAPVPGVPLATWNADDGAPSPGSTLTAIGFGKTEDNELSLELLQADLQSVSGSSCSATYPGMIADYMMICAGKHRDSGENRRTCAGDSGSPLLMNGVAYGLASFGIRDGDDGCSPRVPSVFTRVSNFDNWIRETVCRHSSTGAGFCGDGGDVGGGPRPPDPEDRPVAERENGLVQLFLFLWNLLVDLFT